MTTAVKLPCWAPADLVEGVPEEPPAIVRGLLVLGAITELSASIKSGKTTFELAMIRACLERRPFLGCPTESAFWMVLTEERRQTLAEALRRAGLVEIEGDDVWIVMRHEVAQVPWPELVKAAVAVAQQAANGRPIGLIVDTLSRVARLPPDAEKDAGAAAAAMEPLVQAAGAGVAVLTVRHDRKGGGEVGESARGSSAFGGEADILLNLRRLRRDEGVEDSKSTVRELAALSRFSGTPGQDDPIRIRLEQDGRYAVLGTLSDTQADRADRLHKAVLGWVEDHPGAMATEVRDHVQGKAADISTAVKVLLEENRLARGAVTRHRSDGRPYVTQGLYVSVPEDGERTGTSRNGEPAKAAPVSVPPTPEGGRERTRAMAGVVVPGSENGNGARPHLEVIEPDIADEGYFASLVAEVER